MHQASQNRWLRGGAMALVLLMGSLVAPMAQATPSVYWDHLQMASDDPTVCVSKANQAMVETQAGRITRDDEAVRAWTEKTYAVIECLRINGKVLAMVLVSSEDPTKGSALHMALKTHMGQ